MAVTFALTRPDWLEHAGRLPAFANLLDTAVAGVNARLPPRIIVVAAFSLDDALGGLDGSADVLASRCCARSITLCTRGKFFRRHSRRKDVDYHRGRVDQFRRWIRRHFPFESVEVLPLSYSLPVNSLEFFAGRISRAAHRHRTSQNQFVDERFRSLEEARYSRLRSGQ